MILQVIHVDNPKALSFLDTEDCLEVGQFIEVHGHNPWLNGVFLVCGVDPDGGPYNVLLELFPLPLQDPMKKRIKRYVLVSRAGS